jgi:AraC-like DNA-binding protein
MEDNGSQVSVPAFSYAGAPKGHDYEAWREQFCRRFCQLDAEPGVAERIECTVEVTRVASLSFGAAQGTSCSFLRTRTLLTDGCDDLVLVAAVEGDVLTLQRGRTVELRQAQMCLMSLDELAECALNRSGRFTALRIPRHELVRICREAEDKLSKPLAEGNPRLRGVVAGYFALCADTAGTLDAVGQHAMAQHMTELVALLLRDDANDMPPALRDRLGGARVQLIKAEALKRLGDIDLTIRTFARQAGLTPKQMQRLFGTTGSTFSEFVLEQRLLLAHRLLANTGGAEKISTIAHNAGFGDLSYFNRSFRRRFDMTPSEWRDAGRPI